MLNCLLSLALWNLDLYTVVMSLLGLWVLMIYLNLIERR